MAEKWPTASEMMIPDPFTVDAGETLSVALGRMQSRGAREIPVTERGKLAGMLSYETVGRRRSLSLTTKVRHLMSIATTVPPRATFPEVAGRLLDCDGNAIGVVDPRDGKLLGTLSGIELARYVGGLPSLAELPIAEEMNPVASPLCEKDPSTALFSRTDSLRAHPLPVVDARERLVGSVSLREMGEAFWRPMTSGKRDAGESHPAAGALVGSIMRPNPPTVGREATVGDCARLMARTGRYCVYVVEGDRPLGSLSVTDLLSIAARSGETVEGALVQISGLSGVADASILSAMDRVLANGLKRIAHVEKPAQLTLHFSPHSSHRLADSTVLAKLQTESGHVYRASRTDWNLLGSVTTLLEELERQVKEAKAIGKARRHAQSARWLPATSVELSAEEGLEMRLQEALVREPPSRKSRGRGRP